MAAVAVRTPLPLPNGGYLCDREFCAYAEARHEHCECGLPRRPGDRRCRVCRVEPDLRRDRRRYRAAHAEQRLLRLLGAMEGLLRTVR